MLRRLQAAIDSGDLQVINMHKDGDGPQILELFARPVEKVLRELIGDLRFAGHQHFAFHEYKDPHGNRLFAGDANGSVSFQLAQIKIGNDKVPVSNVLCIDGTFLKKGIPIRPVYSEYRTPYRMLYRVRYRMHMFRYRIRYLLYSSDIVHDIVCNNVCSMESDSVLAVGCLNNDRSVLAKSCVWRPLLPILKGSACAETNDD
jgi:hypothetical protein